MYVGGNCHWVSLIHPLPKSSCVSTSSLSSQQRFPVVRFSYATTIRRRPLNLRVLGGWLREVRLYTTNDKTVFFGGYRTSCIGVYGALRWQNTSLSVSVNYWIEYTKKSNHSRQRQQRRLIDLLDLVSVIISTILTSLSPNELNSKMFIYNPLESVLLLPLEFDYSCWSIAWEEVLCSGLASPNKTSEFPTQTREKQ